MNTFDILEKKLKEEALVDKKTIKILKHEVIKKRENNFKKEKICIYPSCLEKSIRKSHTIQKSKSLKIIADENHVLQPMLNEKSNEIEMYMNRVGINDASTFPGFCTKHEKLFSGFESIGHISTIEHGQQQSYRSICREIVFYENELESVKYMLRRYLDIRNKNAFEYIKKKANKKLKSVELEFDDTFVTTQKKCIKCIEQKLNVLKEYHESLLETFQANQKKHNIFTKGIVIDISLPIALCGIASVGIEENGNRRIAYCILNVIPGKKSTTIIIAGLNKDKGILDPYWEYYTQNNISILNLIESFMIHGSDHWFIKPSIWIKKTIEKQKSILNEILASNKSFLEQFELSIFDEIRAAFITQLDKQQKWAYQKNIEDLINFENKKFHIENYKPTRDVKKALLEFINRIE